MMQKQWVWRPPSRTAERCVRAVPYLNIGPPASRLAARAPAPLRQPDRPWPSRRQLTRRAPRLEVLFEHRFSKLPPRQRAALLPAARWHAPFAGHEHLQPDAALQRARQLCTGQGEAGALRVAAQLVWPRGAPAGTACAQCAPGAAPAFADVLCDIMRHTPTVAEVPLRFLLTSCHLDAAYARHLCEHA